MTNPRRALSEPKEDADARDAARWRKYCEWLILDREGKATPLDGLSDFTAVEQLTVALDAAIDEAMKNG